MTARTLPVSELGPVQLIGSQRFKMWSEHVGANFIIDVSMPGPLSRSKGPAPVMFVTDGNLCFPAAASLSGSLAIEPDGPPPQCVVGIGYEVSGNGENAEHHRMRNRDLTPCEDQRFAAMMRHAPQPFTWRDDISPGGAGRFLSFISEELSPWLSNRFDTDLENSSICGISLGGLFVLHTLLTRPQAFRRYIAVSPAIWWADRLLLKIEENSKNLLCGLELDVFMAVGEREEAADPQAKMVSNVQALAQNLDHQNIDTLNLTHMVLAGETHMSVFSPALSRALRSVFPKQSRDEGWAKLEEK